MAGLPYNVVHKKNVKVFEYVSDVNDPDRFSLKDNKHVILGKEELLRQMSVPDSESIEENEMSILFRFYGVLGFYSKEITTEALLVGVKENYFRSERDEVVFAPRSLLQFMDRNYPRAEIISVETYKGSSSSGFPKLSP